MAIIVSSIKFCEIAVKSELLACTRENGPLSHLWERSTVIVLMNYSPTVVG